MLQAKHFLDNAQVFRSAGLIASPDVSVILPTYCRGPSGLLARAIESVLAQTSASFELIVMDDGSTDGTADIVADYVRADDRVVHVRHERNCGLPALRVNEGLMMSRGRFCAYQFDDDRWTPPALALLTAALRDDDQVDVAYGTCMFREGEQEYPLGLPFDYSRLIIGNFIANNALIHRREVFERYGGYDAHIVMRRLCDWDLWLRWGRRVRFCHVPEIVSLVEAATDQSLGRTVHYDSLIARVHMSRDRDALLTPTAFPRYRIDGLENLAHLGAERVAEVWRQQMAPFQSRHRDLWPSVQPVREVPLHVVVTKAHFDTTVDITIRNFEALLADSFRFTFVPQAQVDASVIACADILLLHRTIDQQGHALLSMAREAGKCVVFFLDDDLLSFHELSEEFSYLAPGTPFDLALRSQIRDADLAVAYSGLINESMAAINPRVVRLETNLPERWLAPARARIAPDATPVDAEVPLRIAFTGGAARKEELATLWPALADVSRGLKKGVEFHFWGFTPERAAELESPVFCQPFTFSYEEYLGRLVKGGFDVMIAPLFADKRAKRAKCPIKFLEIAAAGALGVFSDVEPYAVVVDGVSGIKCANTVEGWSEALWRAVRLDAASRRRMVRAAIARVELDYTSEAQAPWVGATLEASLCHARFARPERTGRARIAYFCHSPYLGGAENHLLRHATIAQSFAFEPILVLPDSARQVQDEMQRRAADAGIEVVYLPIYVETEINTARALEESFVDQIRKWLLGKSIALVHSVTLMREVGEACRLAAIPHVASLYATTSTGHAGVAHCDGLHSDSLLYANQWAGVLGTPSRRILSHVPDAYFQLGRERLAEQTGRAALSRRLRIGVFGSLQARKGQLQAVEAVGLLGREHGVEVEIGFWGYERFFPDYLRECVAAAQRYNIEDRVCFHGFVRDTVPALEGVDIVLCASDWESLPQVVLEGMAAGRLIVAPPVGGVTELISESTGVLLRDNSAREICAGLVRALRLAPADLEARLELAYQVVLGECRRDAVASALFALYREAHARAAACHRMAQVQEGATATAEVPADQRILRETLQRVRARLREMSVRTGR